MISDLSVLVVDDEAYVRDSLRRVLESEGCRATGAADVADALGELARQRIDVVVSDLRIPGGDVHTLLERLGPESERVPVIVITGTGTVDEAVRAMKAGAFDLLQKPVDPHQLLLMVERAVGHSRLRLEVDELRRTLARLHAPRVLVGRSAAMRAVRDLLSQAGPTDATVLITGESGTGKELAAEELHRRSRRAGGPLRRLGCVGIGAQEVARFLSEVESVPDVTLLLDEVGALSAEQQAVLVTRLDVLAATPGGPRVIATTNADLEQLVQAGRWRPDLFWRLNVVAIQMPPLREHREDLADLVEHFLAWSRHAEDPAGAALPNLLAPQVLDVLASYAWPGNVRELRNTLERLVILAAERPIDASLLRDVLEPVCSSPIEDPGPEALLLRPNLDAVERDLVLRALERSGGLKKQAAHLLGIDPRNLGYYLRKHGL